jgi:ketosteroid isomerase-like protein
VSQENVEIVRRVNAAFNRGDRDAMFAYYHPDLELRDLQHAPDAQERLCGIDAVGAALDQWEGAFDEGSIDTGECVVRTTHWLGRGKDSGLEIDPHTVDVFEFANGKIVRITIGYADQGEALKAVGLIEDAARVP